VKVGLQIDQLDNPQFQYQETTQNAHANHMLAKNLRAIKEALDNKDRLLEEVIANTARLIKKTLDEETRLLKESASQALDKHMNTRKARGSVSSGSDSFSVTSSCACIGDFSDTPSESGPEPIRASVWTRPWKQQQVRRVQGTWLCFQCEDELKDTEGKQTEASRLTCRNLLVQVPLQRVAVWVAGWGILQRHCGLCERLLFCKLFENKSGQYSQEVGAIQA
jgi:hypothetical protein